MTFDELKADVDFWSGTDDVTLTPERKTALINLALDKAHTKILQADSRWKFDDSNNTTLPIATTDLVAGQKNYAFPATHLKVLRMRVRDRKGVWRTLDAVDRRTVPDSVLNASGEPVAYDKMGTSFIPLPTPDYSYQAGLELEYQRAMDKFEETDTDKEPGFSSDFHRLVSLYASEDYLGANDLGGRLARVQAKIKEMEADLKDYYTSRDIDDEPYFEVAKSKRAIGTLTRYYGRR